MGVFKSLQFMLPTPSRKLSAKKTVLIFVSVVLTYSIVSTVLRYEFQPKTTSFSLSPPAGHPRELSSEQPQSSVGKVHAVFGDPNPTYERALRLHERHSDRHGHPMFVLRERVLSGLWSKPAYILSIIVQELAIPPELRLKWLLWNDADVVLMNSNLSLEFLIPPSPEYDYVNLLVTDDRNGLNNGVFLIKVCDWSVKLLSSVVAFHGFRPEVPLKYTEQSALEEMIEDRYWRRSVVKVPQYWFNSYPPSELDSDKVLHNTSPKPHEFRPGDLQIHFASNRDGLRSDRMSYWMDVAEKGLIEWNGQVENTFYPEALSKFWGDLSAKRAAKGIISR